MKDNILHTSKVEDGQGKILPASGKTHKDTALLDILQMLSRRSNEAVS